MKIASGVFTFFLCETNSDNVSMMIKTPSFDSQILFQVFYPLLFLLHLLLTVECERKETQRKKNAVENQKSEYSILYANYWKNAEFEGSGLDTRPSRNPFETLSFFSFLVFLCCVVLRSDAIEKKMVESQRVWTPISRSILQDNHRNVRKKRSRCLDLLTNEPTNQRTI